MVRPLCIEARLGLSEQPSSNFAYAGRATSISAAQLSLRAFFTAHQVNSQYHPRWGARASRRPEPQHRGASRTDITSRVRWVERTPLSLQGGWGGGDLLDWIAVLTDSLAVFTALSTLLTPASPHPARQLLRLRRRGTSAGSVSSGENPARHESDGGKTHGAAG
jgi:hypothetical protein